MGLMNFLNTAFESGTSNTTKVYSILSANAGANTIQTPNNTLTETNSQQNTELYNFLYNYTFAQYIVNQIKNTIKDIFSKSSLNITVKRDQKKYEKLEKAANDFLSEINFFSVIEYDLYDILYYGNYGYKIDFKDKRMKRLADGFGVETEDTYCTDRKLIITNWVDKDERMKDKKYKYVLLPVQYQPKKYKEYTEVDAYIEEEIRNRGHVDVARLRADYLKDHPNADKVIKHTIYRGTGVLDAEMNNLLVLYAKELLYDLMGLKDTMRPDILLSRVLDDHTNETDITQAINDIEALVNMGSASSTEPGVQSFLSIQNLLAGIQSYLQNGIKVVPEMNNFSSISNLNLPDLTGKRRQLKDEIDELRQRILKDVGLEDQPSRNQWDAMQNNSKYLTTIEGIVTCISNFAKDVMYEFFRSEYPKDDIKFSEINLDLDTTDIIFNQYALTRARVLTEKVDSISRVLRSIDDFAMNQYVDQTKMIKYVMKLISDLDPTAESFIKTVPQTPPETPEESGGEYGEEPLAEGEGESMEGEEMEGEEPSSENAEG